MDKAALAWGAVVFAIMAAVTTLLISITVCAVMANNVIAILAGVTMFLICLVLGGFAFLSLRANKPLVITIAHGLVAFFALISGALACARPTKLYTTMSRSARAGYGIMIPMGMFLSASVFWLPICKRIFGGFIRIVPECEITQLTIAIFTNAVSAFIAGMFIGLIENFELESEMLVAITLRSVASTFINAFIGALAGVFLAFKAEKAGYTLGEYGEPLQNE